MKGQLSALVNAAWYDGKRWLTPLAPLSCLTGHIAARRLRRFRARNEQPPVPVLVVGNITVGGTGKTPLVAALCKAAAELGLSVVVISRGYGARPPAWPWRVDPHQPASLNGDEPLLLAQLTGAPVIIDPRRRDALAAAVALRPDLVISDDGLQHYELPRTAELVVLDGVRGLGNGLCLPAGPLREPAARLRDVDWLVVNGDASASAWPDAVPMHLVPDAVVNAVTGRELSLEQFARQFVAVHAAAGIGHPERFFSVLTRAGLQVSPHVLPDHHVFQPGDLDFPGTLPVVITEKDLVKCEHFVTERVWVLPVRAVLPPGFAGTVLRTLVERHQSGAQGSR